MVRFAPADQAAGGRDLDHHRVALDRGADAERHLQFLGNPVAGGIGFDVDDLHFRTPIIRIVADAPPANPGVHPEGETHNAVGFSKGSCREFPQFPQVLRQSRRGVHPLGETVKLRVSRARVVARGFRQFPPGFRRFAPSSKRAPFPKDSRFPPFPPFPPVVCCLAPRRAPTERDLMAPRAQVSSAGAARVPGFAEGRASVTGHG